MLYHFVQCWVDGGCLGRNPAPRGVYWSAVIENGLQNLTLKDMSTDYHSNQDAELLAVRSALQWCVAQALVHPVVIHSDSQFAVRLCNGHYHAHEPRHQALLAECKALAEQLPWVAWKWVPRAVIVAKVGH